MTNLTLATTLVHVLLELPAIGLYAVVAIKGPTIVHSSPIMCQYEIAVHYLAVVEASIPFFTYVAYSHKFRQLTIARLTCDKQMFDEFSNRRGTICEWTPFAASSPIILSPHLHIPPIALHIHQL